MQHGLGSSGSATGHPRVQGSGTKAVPPDMERFAPTWSPMAVATSRLEHRFNQAAASPTRSVVQGRSAVNRMNRGSSVAILSQDHLGYQDPWDGCEDLASEGLAEWQQDFQRLNASSIQDDIFLMPDPVASCSSMSSRQEKSNVFQRESVSTLSTATSLESSTSRSLRGSRGSAFTSLTSRSTMINTSLSEREVTVNKSGEDSDGNDDWELEFMMRAKMDAAEAGTLCNN